jgi:hypothetical protein
LGKPYGIKVRCYWECFGEKLENLGNPLGPHESTLGNMMKTRKEIIIIKSLPPSSFLKRENFGPLMGPC